MSKKKIFLTVVVVILVGLVCGWFLQQWWGGGVPVSPVQVGTPPAATKPLSKAGFCCATPGSACTQVTDPGVCFRAGGRAFNAVQANCDYYCTHVKP